MERWERGNSMSFTIIVSIITASPMSPPGMVETKKARAFKSGSYKTVFQICESIVSSYIKNSKSLEVGHPESGYYLRGSIWFFCQGWHRRMRRIPRRRPFPAPYFFIACFVYSEQVG